MTDVLQNSRGWPHIGNLSRFTLYPGATNEQITAAQERIGYKLPLDYRDFLRVTNGSGFEGFLFFPIDRSNRSAGAGVAVLHDLTRDPETWPVLAVGTMDLGSDERIGFLKSDLATSKTPCPVYVFWHEEGNYDLLADSFRALIDELIALPPGIEYVPLWMR